MPLFVQKFGGTSVGTIERIEACADIVAAHAAEDIKLVVVVSAMSGQTNNLLDLAQQIHTKPSRREQDAMVATGEIVSASLLALALHKRGVRARSFAGWQVPIRTDEHYSRARIADIGTDNINYELNRDCVVIVAGFQGLDKFGNVTTLGRGGSDTTAVALAAALQADECQIYTDVNGVYTADPRVVPRARRLDQIFMEEMLELSSLGSKVLQIRCVEFAARYNVPIRVLSSFEPDKGTLIVQEGTEAMEEVTVTGVAHQADEAKLTIVGVPDEPGVAAQIIQAVGDANINIDMILQNTGADGSTNFTFTTPRADCEQCVDILQQLQAELGAKDVQWDTEVAKVSIVGLGMRSHAGVAGKMFQALARENINIQLIATSEIKISVLIDLKYTELAVRTLHGAFNLEATN